MTDTKDKLYEAKTFSNSISSTPPPSYQYASASSNQILDVHYANWRTHITIEDTAGQELYVSRGARCSTSLEISNHQGTIGCSKSSKFSSKIDVEMGGSAGTGRKFEMHNSIGIFGGSPRYSSPAFGEKQVIWKNKAMSANIIYTLLDERSVPLAEFESNRKTKIGKLEISDEVQGEEQLNEVVVTLLTLLHRKLRNIKTSQYGMLSASGT